MLQPCCYRLLDYYYLINIKDAQKISSMKFHEVIAGCIY